jgi:hypothetical protein
MKVIFVFVNICKIAVTHVECKDCNKPTLANTWSRNWHVYQDYNKNIVCPLGEHLLKW